MTEPAAPATGGPAAPAIPALVVLAVVLLASLLLDAVSGYLPPLPVDRGALRVILSNLPFLIAAPLWRRRLKTPELDLRGRRRSGLMTFIALAAMSLIFVPVQLGTERMHGDRDSILLVALLVPFAEELYFRGMLLDMLRRCFGAPVAAALVAALFSWLHLAQGWQQCIAMAGLSLVLTAATLASGTVVWAIALHVVWNTCSFIYRMPLSFDRANIGAWATIVVLVLVGIALLGGRRRAREDHAAAAAR